MLKKTLLTLLLTSLLINPAFAENKKTNIGSAFSDAIIQRYQPTIDALAHHGWDHSNSIILHGIEKIYKNTKNPSYFNYIKTFVDQYVNEDGHIEKINANLDGLHPGILCLFMYEQTKEERYLKAAVQMRNFFLGTKETPSTFNKTPDGIYWHKNVEKYHNVASVDGLYMVYPYLIRLALITNDALALDVATEQVLLISERSFNIKNQLPYHAWNYDKTKAWAHPITGTSTQFWSRASGWYSMALVDILEVLPKTHKNYQKIHFLYQSFAQGLERTQNPKDGLWYQVLDAYDQPNNYPETSCTGMIVYSLEKGAKLKLLDKKYSAIARKGWQALQTKISTFDDGGPQINSFAPGMSSQLDYNGYVAIRPVSVPTKEKKQNAHGYMGILMAASMMEP